MSRLTRIERRLMETEYYLDSTTAHVRRTGCSDIKPLALARIQKGLNAVRAAIAMVREEQGARHPTLSAGSAGGPQDGARGKQKSWGPHKTPHAWMKDCLVVDVLDPEIEKGKVAECWHCDQIFVKKVYCAECGFYLCPACEKCACQLPSETRRMLEKTVRAMAGLGGVPLPPPSGGKDAKHVPESPSLNREKVP